MCARPYLLLLAASLLAGCRAEAPSPLAALGEGWNVIESGGETRCSDGSPFEFYARAGSPDSVLVYLHGGGACWFGASCDRDARPSYQPVVNREGSLAPGGILDMENPENPFGGYTMVVVPYCTGDVHIGRRTTTYQAPAHDSLAAHDVTVAHQGYANVTAALDWLRAHVETPRTIFVSGSSAGAIPSPLYAARMAALYPAARVVQLGDGAGAYRMNGAQQMAAWGAEPPVEALVEGYDVPTDSVTFEAFYAAVAHRYPDVVLAQYNTAEDDVQRQFLQMSGLTADSLKPLIEANYADIRAAGVTLHTYTAPGTLHTILQRPEFYTQTVGGVRLRDWVARLAAAEPLEDVTCTDCTGARPAAASPAGPAS